MFSPRSPNEWEAVSRHHIENYPGHTQDSIRRKFNSLANHKKPTGDPNCPPTVRRAKRIFALIRERIDISEREDDLGPDFLAPVPLPEVGVGEVGDVGVGDAEEVAVQEDNVGTIEEQILCENVPVVQRPGVGAPNQRAIARSASNNEGDSDAVQRPSIEGLCVHTPRRNVVSSSNQAVNHFHKFVQFMMVRADAEAHSE